MPGSFTAYFMSWKIEVLAGAVVTFSEVKKKVPTPTKNISAPALLIARVTPKSSIKEPPTIGPRMLPTATAVLRAPRA